MVGSTLELPNFLYVAFLHFVICCVVLFVFSLFGQNKPESELAKVVWTKDNFQQETLSLKEVPWYKNYRIQALALIALTLLILLAY